MVTSAFEEATRAAAARPLPYAEASAAFDAAEKAYQENPTPQNKGLRDNARAALKKALDGSAEPEKALDDRAPRVGLHYAEALALWKSRSRQDVKPIATGWDALDKQLGGGLWPGLHVVSGGTGIGKTQFALQITELASERGLPCWYIGLELGKADTVARLLCLKAQRRYRTDPAYRETHRRPPMWSELHLGLVGEDVIDGLDADFGEQVAAMGTRLELPPPQGWSAGELEHCATRLRELHPEEQTGKLPMLFVLDFLQLVGEDPAEDYSVDLRERIKAAAYKCRQVARQENLSAVVLVVSSVSRENAMRLVLEREEDKLGKGDASRMVGLSKESGDVEFAANTVIALCSGGRIGETADRPNGYATMVHVAIAKSRECGASWLKLAFDGAYFWEPAAGEAESAPEPKKKKGNGSASGEAQRPVSNMEREY